MREQFEDFEEAEGEPVAPREVPLREQYAVPRTGSAGIPRAPRRSDGWRYVAAPADQDVDPGDLW